jgi:hypothetical protein
MGAATAIMLLSACSGGSTIAPRPAAQDITHHRSGAFILPAILRHNLKSYNSCPATGPIEYVGDGNSGYITVFAGKFHSQTGCGLIVPNVFDVTGLYVDRKTHDLYVAKGEGGNVIVYHRGQATPYNTYVDPTVEQFVDDVTLLNDGTLVAINRFSYGSELGSISSWKLGPNGGTFVGNFPITSGGLGSFITAAVNGNVYFDASELYNTDLWMVACPSGACGTQTRVPGVLGVEGLAFDSNGDLVADDAAIGTSNVLTADTFELPNPLPTFFAIANPGGLGIAFDETDRHLFVAQVGFAGEYTYPGGQLVGEVTAGSFSGDLAGIAFDQ